MTFRNSLFFRDVRPRHAAAELIAYLREPRAYRRTFLLLSCIPFALLFAGFYLDALAKNVPPPQRVIYVESWAGDRSRDESRAANLTRQAAKDAAMERRADAYRSIGGALGLDVARIDREARAIREKARAEARTGVANDTDAATADAPPR
jgi:hypothetical protein